MPGIPAVQAVVFDMDGILFDTETLYFDAGQELYRRRGREFTVAAARRIMGVPGLEAMAILQKEEGFSEPASALFEESQAIFERLLADRLTLMPGVIELLERLETRAIPKAVATSTARALTHQMLGRFSLVERFRFILAREDVGQGKPNPEIYLAAANRLRLPPERVLVIEDSPNGLRAASAAGCVAVAIPHELTRSFDFSAALLVADHLLDPRLLALVGL